MQSEQDWWASWKGVVRNAVLAKWHGHVTLEDCMNVAMGIEAPEPVKDWGATK